MKWSGKTAVPLVEHQDAIAPSVYSYVVVNDSGFAPNPFHGFCTLACCKPVIRRTAKVGDIVVGLSSGCERIVYAMRVGEVLTFADYWNDARFVSKRPDMRSKKRIERRGDNIYRPTGDGELGFEQLHSRHKPKDIKRDLSGNHVLVAEDFVYYGRSGPALTASLEFLRVGRGHRRTREPERVRAVAHWLDAQTKGRRGRPAIWGRSPERSCA